MEESQDRDEQRVEKDDESVQGHGWHVHHHKHRNEAELIDDEDDVEGHGWHVHHHKH